MSGNTVYSALLRKPQHLTIIDEFGKYLEAASGTRDTFRSDALTMLMESFGRVHEALRDRVADSNVERIRNVILTAIREAGLRGVTERDLHRGKAFVGISKRDRVETIESLIKGELVTWTDIPTGDRGGRPRRALVALDPSDNAAQAVGA